MSSEIARRADLSVREKLSLTTGSLADLVKANKTAHRNTFLLLDCSYSMNEPAGQGGRTSKMTALRNVVRGLKDEGVRATMVGFGILGGTNGVAFITEVPVAEGGTPLAEGIEFSYAHGADHLIVVSDGEPNDQQRALWAAQQFAGPIDVFYVGQRPSPGESFLQRLATGSGGQCQSVSLSQTKELSSGLRKLLAA